MHDPTNWRNEYECPRCDTLTPNGWACKACGWDNDPDDTDNEENN